MSRQSGDADRRRGGTWRIVAVVIIAMIVYVLLLGPVIWFCDGLSTVPSSAYDAVEAVYAPLTWLHERTALRRPLDTYVGLWRR